MADKIEFERGVGGQIRFQEKHIRSVAGPTAVSALVAEEATTRSNRNWGKAKEDRAANNTLLCMSVGQQQQLFTSLLNERIADLQKIPRKSEQYTDVSNITINGCAILGGKAYQGGLWTLGLKRPTDKSYLIVHLGYWDWTGRQEIAQTGMFPES